MKLDKKLDFFYESVIEEATKQSNTILEDYKASLQELYDTKKEEALRKAQTTLSVETDHLIRQKNKSLSTESINIRRTINEKNNELKEKLFLDVQQKLMEFMKTPAYDALLVSQIQAAVTFARGERMTLYINHSDESKKEALESKTNTSLTVSTMDFLGGTRAVIHEKHILIDNSFTTKLAEEKDKFRF